MESETGKRTINKRQKGGGESDYKRETGKVGEGGKAKKKKTTL